MQLRYEDDFVEGAVFLRANSRSHGPPSLQVRRFHVAREKLYSILDPDNRNAASFQLHLEWFREWGMERRLIGVADEFPRLRTVLGALVFRKARGRDDEGAELYVSAENGRVGVVALRVERFDELDELARFLRHEFMHVDDMVNPAFGYSPQLVLAGGNAAHQRAARERYRLLWDISIDGRLVVAGRSTAGSRARHRDMFDRAFGFWPEGKRDVVFDSLWRNGNPRHEDLLAIASDPRDLRATHEPLPGAPCPLCGFTTFDWTDPSRLDGPTTGAIRREFSQWTSDQGVCGRCVEIYRRVAAQSPAVV